jgi:hypothetical protein
MKVQTSFLTHTLALAAYATAFALSTQAPVQAATATGETSYKYLYNWERPHDQFLVDSGYDWCTDGTCYHQIGQPLGFRDSHARHESLSTTYDELTQTLTWSSSYSGNHNLDGGWLVLSDGPNPKHQDLEYAIFYLDTDANRLTAYAYNGQNNATSYSSNPFLGSWENVIETQDYFAFDENSQQVARQDISFAINVANLNAGQDQDGNAIPGLDPSIWKGAAYGNNVGIWKHFGTNTNATYDSNGEITSFSSWDQYFDTGSLATLREERNDEVVEAPEPVASIGILGAVAALGLIRRKQAS